MKRFASIAAAAAIAATCLVTPTAVAEENKETTRLSCEQFKAGFDRDEYEGKTAKDFADAYREKLIKSTGKNSYSKLDDEQKRVLRIQVSIVVRKAQECNMFVKSEKGSSPTGSLSLSSALFGSS